MFESFMKKGYDRSYLSRLYENVWRDREIFCILLGPNGDPGFLNSLRELARKRTVDEWNTEFPKYSRENLNFLFDYVFPGLTASLLSWFENDHGISPEEFARRMERLGHYGLLAVKEFI